MESTLPPIALDIREVALQGIPDAEQKLMSDLVNRVIANLVYA